MAGKALCLVENLALPPFKTIASWSNISTNRPDFTSYIVSREQRADGMIDMSRGEIDANTASFDVEGSETTAALLSGCIFYILQHPSEYQQVVQEVCGAFSSNSAIRLSALNNLAYLNAALAETLRIYPPIPAMLPRLVPKGGAVIQNQFVPEGVSSTSTG